MNPYQKSVALGMAVGTLFIAIVTLERFCNYIKVKKTNPNHDISLHGFKLSTLIVICSLLLVLMLGAVTMLFKMCGRCCDV